MQSADGPRLAAECLAESRPRSWCHVQGVAARGWPGWRLVGPPLPRTPVAVALVAALPFAVWEFSLGVHLVVEGFRRTPLTSGPTPLAMPPIAVSVG